MVPVHGKGELEDGLMRLKAQDRNLEWGRLPISEKTASANISVMSYKGR